MEFIQQNIYLVIIAVLSGSMLLATSFRRSGTNTLSPTQATLLINRENPQLIDVRAPADYQSGHLLESHNIPLEQFDERVSELEKFKDTPLILICQSGMRSASACAKLNKLGFTKSHNLEGGIDAWLRAGLPVNKGTTKGVKE